MRQAPATRADMTVKDLSLKETGGLEEVSDTGNESVKTHSLELGLELSGRVCLMYTRCCT